MSLISPKFPLFVSIFFISFMLSKTIFLHQINIILHETGLSVCIVDKACVFECSQVTLGSVILLRVLNLAPSAPVVCHALQAGLRGSCRVHRNSPVTSEASRAELTLNHHQGDPAAPVAAQTERPRPAPTAHLTLTLRHIPQLAVVFSE